MFHPTAHRSRLAALLITSLATLLLPGLGYAGLSDLSDNPLSSATTAQVKPNVMFVLDNSGSMVFRFMPDTLKNKQTTVGIRNHKCNLIYYNPDSRYVIARTSTNDDVNSGAQTAFNAAYIDGFWPYYGGSSATTNLQTSFQAFVNYRESFWTYDWSDYTTPNSDSAQPAYYWKYLGSQSLLPLTGDCEKTLNAYDDSTTLEICTDGTRTTGSCAALLPTAKTALWKKVVVSSTSGPGSTDINGDGSINASDKDERQNFANWYSYYRNRLNAMKSSTGRAFVGLTDSKRVGFITINTGSGSVSSSKYLPIADLDTSQKLSWFTTLYAQRDASGGTPLRQALSRVGRHFAGKIDGINNGMSGDPVQYSCQQNFTILTTDGYWNGDPGALLNGDYLKRTSSDSGSTWTDWTTTASCSPDNSGSSRTDCAIGNHDGVISELDAYRSSGDKYLMSPRPIYDGASTTYTWNTASNAYRTATCVFSAQPQQRTIQWQRRTVDFKRCKTNGTSCENIDFDCAGGTNHWWRTRCVVNNDSGWANSDACSPGYIDPTTTQCNSTSDSGWADIGSCTPTDPAGGPTVLCQNVNVVNGSKLQYLTTTTATTYSGPNQAGTPLGTPVTTTGSWTDVSPATCYATPPAVPATAAITDGGPPAPPANCTSGSQVWPCETYSAGAGGLSASISGASWTAPGADPTIDPATATYTTSAAHNFLVGHTVDVSGVNPSGYRGTLEIIQVADNTHFTVLLPTNPGAYTSSGTATLYSGSNNSLADVAQYYYNTDLRNATLGNCTGALGGSTSVCDDNVPSTGAGVEDDRANWQHMTTFTMGLGLTGTVAYSPTYKTDQCVAKTILSATWASNLVTVTTSTPHSYYVNESVTISGGSFAGYRGQFRISTVPSATTFTYSRSPNPGGAFGSGTVTGCPDFARIRSGSMNWPTPAAESTTALDDLWHAAVNGRGQYFSAGDPDTVVSSLSSALTGINARVAAAAAAATSNLEPVAGDNFAYTAKYKTLAWTGDLEAREIDLATGAVSGSVVWSAQAKLDAATKSACDNRNIKLFHSGATNNLVDFKWNTFACDAGGAPTGLATTTLDATEKSNFDATKVALLSHYPNLGDGTGITVNQRTPAAGVNLVNFLRGQRGKEGFSSGPPITNTDVDKLYRAREHILGDIINAQPVFVKAPFANYDDTGYAAFKSAKAGRTPTVYSAANDGMLHAINAGTSIVDTEGGKEAWAFIPTMVLPNLYKLASENYATEHTYSVDGTPSVGDVYDTTSTSWRTILVSGLNKGGKGYFALDVTDPATPTALWEFKHDASNCVAVNTTTKAPATAEFSDCHLGYSFNNPIISKLRDGRWVVFVTSGYNNVNAPSVAGDGVGYLYVLDAMTGQILYKISTGAGSAADPSGLNHISGWAENPLRNNQTERIYGVDLKGNVWRFDVNDILNASGREATRVAQVVDASGVEQSITTRPELSEVQGQTFVYVSTGRYLGTTDLSSTQTQSVWALHDNLSSSTLTSLRTTLRKMVITNQGSGTSAFRTIGCMAQCGSTDGWFADLPDTGERVNIDMKLQLGTLVVASNVPESNACNIGGYAWLNYFNNSTGQAIANSADSAVGRRLVGAGGQESLAVGLNIVRLPSGKTVVIATTSAAQQLTVEAPFDIPPPTGKRVSWREIVQ